MGEPLLRLIKLADYASNWEKYLNALYDLYLEKIVKANLEYDGLPVRYQFRPLCDGKGHGFWHLISDGKEEVNRIPDLRRCERILWIAWVINNAQKSTEISWYKNKRGSSYHIVLWYRTQNYVVILAQRSNYYLLKSAYILTPHREKTIKKEYDQYWGKS